MENLPLVSIVTPSYNQAEYLEATILSVLNQDYERIEYIIVDGGSTDGSLEIIRRHSGRLARWVSEPDRGQANAINKGLEMAAGEILGWLNSDDLYLPDTVSRAVEVFQSRPEVDVVYGRLERINAAGRVIPTPVLPKDRVVMTPRNLLGDCVVNQPGSFWRRELMERAGMLNESLRYAMDYEYWMRLLVAGGRFHRLSELLAHFRLSEGSKTVSQAEGMAAESIAVIETMLARPDLPGVLGLSQADLVRQANRGRAVHSLHAALACFKAGKWPQALRWLAAAHRYNPLVLAQRRWFDLASARLKRGKVR
jgi:glycosyltransferase involved in cell wall biosynthesis